MDTNDRMNRKGFSRRKFLALAGIGAASFAVNSKIAFASDQEKVRFTEEVAIDLANEFASSNFPEKNITAESATKLYANDLSPFGYIVEYATASGESGGYIVFDATNNGMIYEFSVSDGAISPYKRAINSSGIATRSSTNPLAVIESPFIYAAFLPSESTAIDMYGNDASDCIEPISTLSTPDTEDWNDIFITIGSGWTFKSQNHAPQQFISFSREEVEAASGRYACVVSAMLNCAPHYIGSSSFPWGKIGNDYIELWDRSATSTLYTRDGILYGDTVFQNACSAMREYCSNRGVAISASYERSPSFPTFKNVIDRGDMAIFGCGINQNGSRVGHGMAVEGYAVLKNGSISEDIYTLIVADGWGYGARYLSFYYTRFTDTHGVYFKK